MLYKKSKTGLIEPENDYQYQAILAMRDREKAEKKVAELSEEVNKIKKALGIE